MFRLPEDISASLTIARKTLLKFQKIGRQLQPPNAFLKIVESTRRAMEKIMAQFKPIPFEHIHIKSFAVPKLSYKLPEIFR